MCVCVCVHVRTRACCVCVLLTNSLSNSWRLAFLLFITLPTWPMRQNTYTNRLVTGKEEEKEQHQQQNNTRSFRRKIQTVLFDNYFCVVSAVHCCFTIVNLTNNIGHCFVRRFFFTFRVLWTVHTNTHTHSHTHTHTHTQRHTHTHSRTPHHNHTHTNAHTRPSANAWVHTNTQHKNTLTNNCSEDKHTNKVADDNKHIPANENKTRVQRKNTMWI